MLLQTTDLIVENTSRTKQAEIKDSLKLNEITKEKMFINTFGDSKTNSAYLDKVDLILGKNAPGKNAPRKIAHWKFAH